MSTPGEPTRGCEPGGKGEPPKRVRGRRGRVGRREKMPATVTARAVERYRFRRRKAAGAGAPAAETFVKEDGNMRRLFALTLAALLALTALAGAETFKVGMECNYAPFNWTQTEASEFAVPIAAGGFADGYDVQVARKVAEGLGMELEIVKTEWDGLPVALTSGKIDAIIAGMSPTEERMVTIDFTDPYYVSDLVIVVMKDGPYAGAKSLADFTGARITGQLNTLHYDIIDEIPGVQKQTALESFTAMIVALAAGRIDGYISERPGAISAMMSNPEFSYVAFEEGQGFNSPPILVSVGLQKGSPMKDQINAILADIDEAARARMMEDAIARQPLSE